MIAPAGSGKTAVLVARIGHLPSIGIEPARILVCTGTQKAVHEMKSRVTQAFGAVSGGVTMSTLHEIANQMGKGSGDKWERVTDAVLNPAQFVESDCDQHSPFGVVSLWPLGQTKRMIAWAKSLDVALADANDSKLHDVYRAYEAYLTPGYARGGENLLRRAVNAMRTDAHFAKRWRSRWTYVMVDEFQDTNELEWELMRALAQDTGNLLVTGDDDQSICSFRGARPGQMRAFMSCYPHAKTVLLTKNYRSHDLILTLAQRVIACNWGHGLEQRVEALRAVSKTAMVQVVTAVTDVQEANWLAAEIRTLRSTYPQMPWQEIAILYRTAVQSRVYEEALAEAHIPYTIVGDTRFYESPTVRVMLHYLRMAVHGDHPDGRLSLLRKSRRISQEVGRAKGDRRQALLSDEARFGRSDARFAALQVHVRPDEAIRSLMKRVLVLADTAGEEGVVRWLDALLQSAARYDTLEDFVCYVEWVIERGKSVRRDAVQMMTIHQSKGLAFETVFVAGLAEGLLPHQKAIDKGDVSEETRLCYVAMTRAKENLYLLSAQTYGGRSFAQSRYVTTVQKNSE